MAKKKSSAKKSTPAKDKKTVGKKSTAKKSTPKKTTPKAEPRKRDEVVLPKPALTGEAMGHGGISEVPAPDVTEAPAVAPAPSETIVEVLSSKPQAVNSKALQSYSSAILSTIRKHFRPHTQKEINGIMEGAKYPFHYSIKSRGNDFPNEIFIELTDGNNTERCPVDPNDFITVNG
jgi:hypothetical protein